MKSFSTFYISGAEFDTNSYIAKFHYSFDKEVFFEEIVDFSSPQMQVKKSLDTAVITNLLFHLSIALAISYYKLFPTQKIIIENGFLDTEDISFWKKFYKHGLGEFLYKNNISPEELFQFTNTKENVSQAQKNFSLSETYLLPIGGGKDSIVSSIILSELGKSYTNFVFGKIDTIKENCISQNKNPTLFIKRQLSPTLFEMNSAGYYNGHVPITGIISFVLTMTAYLYDFKYIVFSNEKSADEGNLVFEGLDVNHQYSKSLEFENDFRKYLQKNISEEMEYFSILRGFYELQIAKIFAQKAKKYFDIFSSCNRNFTIQKSPQSHTRWCGECPKCLFVYMILRPFLNTQETLQIFGKELYNEETLLPLFEELLGVSKNKPFECVGEKEECFLAAYFGLKMWDGELPYLLQHFRENIFGKKTDIDINRMKEKYFSFYGEGNIPNNIVGEVKRNYGK